jgi:hypothetical protein
MEKAYHHDLFTPLSAGFCLKSLEVASGVTSLIRVGEPLKLFKTPLSAVFVLTLQACKLVCRFSRQNKNPHAPHVGF